MGAIEFKQITKDELEDYRMLILPAVYEELEESEVMDTDYICLALLTDDEAAGAIITDLEDGGDLCLLSIWTDPRFRRQGVATSLLHEMTQVALELYDWEPLQYGDDILLKAMYCLSEEYRTPLEAWLMKNDFTDFTIMKEAEGDANEICGATAEIHFYRSTGL